jgi:RimJ/RimL family protein N-acetyltransferase
MTHPLDPAAGAITPPAGFLLLPWRERIARLRQLRLDGGGGRLQPYSPAFADALRELRNQPANRFNLAQAAELTAAQQQSWGETYLARDNDLCWVVLTRAGEFAGATRLYDIDGEAGTAEKGGLVLREELARASPLALESEIMLLTVAFAWLGLAVVLTQVRPENEKMISVNGRLGFHPAGTGMLRGVAYGRAELTAAGFDPAPLLPILRHWNQRHAR